MTSSSVDRRYFFLRRLHSLSGILPIGAFLLFHFFENASARRGAAAFDETVIKISEMPYLFVLEIGVLLVPILFHAVMGLFITTASRPNVVNYGYARNWAYFFQRVSGIIALLYIVYHVATTRGWALFVKGENITFLDMQGQLSSLWVLSMYVVGIVAVTFHFANGLWSFCITWGVVRSREAQETLAMACMGFFVLLCVVGLDILSAFIVEGGALATLAAAILG